MMWLAPVLDEVQAGINRGCRQRGLWPAASRGDGRTRHHYVSGWPPFLHNRAPVPAQPPHFSIECQPRSGSGTGPGPAKTEETLMGRALLLWLLGVPIPIIILLALLWH